VRKVVFALVAVAVAGLCVIGPTLASAAEVSIGNPDIVPEDLILGPTVAVEKLIGNPNERRTLMVVITEPIVDFQATRLGGPDTTPPDISVEMVVHE